MAGDVGGQRADPPAVEQIVQAMALLRDHDDDALPALLAVGSATASRSASPTGANAVRSASRSRGSVVASTCTRMKKRPVSRSPNCWLSPMLQPLLGQESGDRVHDADPVGTRQREDEAVHVAGSPSRSGTSGIGMAPESAVALWSQTGRRSGDASLIFKMVQDGRPYPAHDLMLRDWAAVPPRQVRLDQLVTTKKVLALDVLLDDDSTFYGDLFPHVVQWQDELYLEDGVHRALRAALQQRTVLHVRVLNLDARCGRRLRGRWLGVPPVVDAMSEQRPAARHSPSRRLTTPTSAGVTSRRQKPPSGTPTGTAARRRLTTATEPARLAGQADRRGQAGCGAETRRCRTSSGWPRPGCCSGTRGSRGSVRRARAPS